jgi:hypothetical protein
MIDEKALAYHCAPSLVWVKDAGQTILVGKEDHTWIIDGVEALIWDLLTLNYSFDRLARFLSVMLEIPFKEAKRTLEAVLHRWNQVGIVVAVEGNGRG